MAWSLACAATISRWTPASTSFASARVRPKSAMSTRPSGRQISTTSAHDPSPSAPISTSLKTQATYPPSVRERARNTRPPSHPQSRDGPVADRADRGITGAVRKADLAQGGVTLCDADAKAKFAAIAAPGRDQPARFLAHRHRHFDGALGGIGARHRVIEEHHDPIAGKLVERSLELAHKPPQRAVVLAQKIEDFLGLGGLGEGGVAAQVAEHDDDLAAMAFKDFLV